MCPHLVPIQPCFLVINQLAADLASNAISFTKSPARLLLPFVCEEKKSQLFDSLISSKCFSLSFTKHPGLLPRLLDVVANIAGIWPLIVSNMKKTGKREDGDSFRVWYNNFFCEFPSVTCPYTDFPGLENRELTVTCTSIRWHRSNSVPFVWSSKSVRLTYYLRLFVLKNSPCSEYLARNF